jgi:4,5-dihydroxyphthalate decarboxylase
MSDLQLSLAMGLNARAAPVLEGAVKPEGIEFLATALHPSEIFWRQLHFADFDVSEMSMSSLLIAVAGGIKDWVGIPVFTSRRFFHTGIWVRNDAHIERPQDLRGKRVGVPEYQQTAALWARGVLQHEFGVSPGEIEWFMERTEARSHGGATGFQPPPGVRVNRIPAEKSIGSMLVGGELDATLFYLHDNNLVDRSRVRLEDCPNVRLLFDDPAAEGRRYFAKSGLYPVNHGMVVRRSIAERHPWVVLNIYNAFRVAKENWLREMREAVQTHLDLGLLAPESAKALAQDPYPYGIVGNRYLLETIARYSHEQGLTPRVVGMDEIFAASTLEL